MATPDANKHPPINELSSLEAGPPSRHPNLVDRSGRAAGSDLSDRNMQPPARLGIRHVQTALLAGTALVTYALRANLSVAIVSMTEEHGDKVYDWDEVTKGLILSSFYWGYTVMQIPGSMLIQRWGAHRFLYGAVLSTSILSALLPPCAYLGDWQLVCANRVLQGLTQGFLNPATYAMMGLWAPAPERSTIAGVILGAQTMGPVVAAPLAGLLVSAFGWPSVFYSYGAFGALYSLLVWRFGADAPATHKTISLKERAYIEATLGESSEKDTAPWGLILSSGPAWAAILTMAAKGSVFLILLTEIPTYLSTVLLFDIEKNGVLSALPYFVSWLLSFPFSMSCDWLLKRGYFSRTMARKTFNSISHVLSGSAILALGFVTDRTLSVVLLTISIGVQAASLPGVQSNFMDLTPNYSGPVFAIANFLVSVLSILGPIAIGVIVTEKGNASQWQTVYCLLSAVMFVGGVIFVAFGSGEVQPWNEPRSPTRERSQRSHRRAEEEAPPITDKALELDGSDLRPPSALRCAEP